MKRQIIIIMAFVLLCVLGVTSVAVSNKRTCNAAELNLKQLPSNDVLLHGPLNYFQL